MCLRKCLSRRGAHKKNHFSGHCHCTRGGGGGATSSDSFRRFLRLGFVRGAPGGAPPGARARAPPGIHGCVVGGSITCGASSSSSSSSYVSSASFGSQDEPGGNTRDDDNAHDDDLAFVRLESTSAAPSPAPGNRQAVALGKFDAMHTGHRQLVRRAASFGMPWLISFHGMAEVLGWPERLPVVANSDRERVLRMWAEDVGVPIRERSLPFSAVRALSPEAFVRDILADKLGASAAVCGANYRFGHRAAGDADTLVTLGTERGVDVAVEDLVEDDAAVDADVVSSSRVRSCLDEGDVELVHKLLARPHRGVVHVQHVDNARWRVCKRANILPADGAYRVRVATAHDEEQVAHHDGDSAVVRLSGDELEVEGAAALLEECGDNCVVFAVDFLTRM